MKNLFKLLFFIVIAGISTEAYAQEEYGADIPGADNYEGECRIDYVNAYRDGKACGDGNESFCGIVQPTSSPECKSAQMEGYAAGYEAGVHPAPNADRDLFSTWRFTIKVGPNTIVDIR